MSTEWFQCAICTENQSQPGKTVRTILGDPICDECLPEVLTLFENALKNEINFPPRWGPTEIPFKSFEDLFSDDFRLAYHEKTREFNTPVPKRVYCKHKVSTSKDTSTGQAETDFCNTFMGVEAKVVSKCSGGTHWMCMECREIALPPPATHTCDPTKADSEKDAFDAATRGVEWQECPNPDCKIKCDLKEGCNAMICPCQENFCFICGEVAGHDSDHWTEGKPCPRWGAVNAPNPMFDRPGPVARPGHPLIIAQDAQGIPDLQHVVIAFAANDRLYMDSEESLTLLEELASEQFFMTDAEDNILQPILEMMRLLRLWQQNFGWLKIDSALAGVDQFVQNQIVDPIDQAIETTNFFIRDEAIQAKLRETHAAALEISGEDSVLFTVPVMEVFERYNTVHKPRLVEHVQQFVAARDAGRALHVREEEQFARRMLRRWASEVDEEDLPHRRASI
jgi:hypothetical protein